MASPTNELISTGSLRAVADASFLIVSFCSARSPDLALFICAQAIANYRSRNDGMARDRPSPCETQRSLMRMMRRLVVMQPQQIYPKIIGDVPPD